MWEEKAGKEGKDEEEVEEEEEELQEEEKEKGKGEGRWRRRRREKEKEEDDGGKGWKKKRRGRKSPLKSTETFQLGRSRCALLLCHPTCAALSAMTAGTLVRARNLRSLCSQPLV